MLITLSITVQLDLIIIPYNKPVTQYLSYPIRNQTYILSIISYNKSVIYISYNKPVIYIARSNNKPVKYYIPMGIEDP